MGTRRGGARRARRRTSSPLLRSLADEVEELTPGRVQRPLVDLPPLAKDDGEVLRKPPLLWIASEDVRATEVGFKLSEDDAEVERDDVVLSDRAIRREFAKQHPRVRAGADDAPVPALLDAEVGRGELVDGALTRSSVSPGWTSRFSSIAKKGRRLGPARRGASCARRGPEKTTGRFEQRHAAWGDLQWRAPLRAFRRA
jgi:hypothetical protein